MMKRALLLLGILALCAGGIAAEPSWWTERQVLDSGAARNDYGPANLGQAKWFAKQAWMEFGYELPGGAGFALTSLFPSPPPGPGQTGYDQAVYDAYLQENYAPLNIGQLKNLAYRYYDRLKALGYEGPPSGRDPVTSYPWTETPGDDANYAPANIGQLKHVFSFDLDSDGDGLLDWEDEDKDGLTNLQERMIGSNPWEQDTDGDGFYDALEARYSFLNPSVWNDPNADHDGDGMTDLFEAIYDLRLDLDDSALDPDGDGLTNIEEFNGWYAAYYGEDVDSSPIEADIDGDGLNDFQERAAQTDPWRWDSDYDFLPDAWELQHGLNPGQWQNPQDDTDQDGLVALDEVRYGTNPNVADSDLDGTPDGTEVANNTDPMDPEWGGPPPAPVSNLVETSNADGSITYTWQDNSDNEDGFSVYTRQADGTWVKIGTVAANETSFTWYPEGGQ